MDLGNVTANIAHILATVIANYATNQSSQIWPKENQNKVSFFIAIFESFAPRLLLLLLQSIAVVVMKSL